MEKQKKKSKGWTFVLAVVVLAGVGAQASLSRQAGAASETPAQAEQRRQAVLARSTIAAGEKALRSVLKDPSSAVFDKVFALEKNGRYAACGLVNAKNGFGAMTGDTPWIAVPEHGLVLIHSEDSAKEFIAAWEEYCLSGVDSDTPAPTEMLDVSFGAAPPASLKPFDASGNVWVYSNSPPSDFMGVPITQVSFVADGGKIFGGSIEAEGRHSYDKLKAVLVEKYGPPTSAKDTGDLLNVWRWNAGAGTVIRLDYQPRFDQTSVYLGIED